MTIQNIQQKIVTILKAINPETVLETVSGATKIIDDLNLHSILFVEFVVELEDAFQIRLKEADIKQITTVDDAASLIAMRIQTA